MDRVETTGEFFKDTKSNSNHCWFGSFCKIDKAMEFQEVAELLLEQKKDLIKLLGSPKEVRLEWFFKPINKSRKGRLGYKVKLKISPKECAKINKKRGVYYAVHKEK